MKIVRIDDLNDNDAVVDFRFRSKLELRRLFNGLRFQEWHRTLWGQKFHGEEIFLCGFYRLHMPNDLGNASWRKLFGFNYSRASKCFDLFLNHMINNWSYLLLDNIEFWIPYLDDCSRAIGSKAFELGLDHINPAAFAIFEFIDNTCNASCRPGGGPTRDALAIFLFFFFLL